MKPRIFVGSSTEGLRVAFAIQEELDLDAEVTVWRQNVFRPNSTLIESLHGSLFRYDYAIFVISPDDKVTSRGQSGTAPRDNVVFELGLFIGRLGREKVFFVAPQGNQRPKIPTDLLGVFALEFNGSRSDGNLRAAVGPACNQIRGVLSNDTSAVGAANEVLGHPTDSDATNQLRATIEQMAKAARDESDGRAYTPIILFADIDRFKAVNNWFGRAVCNEVVAQVEKLFQGIVKDQFWARFGGDQFVSCLRVPTNYVAERLANAVVRGVENYGWESIAPGLYITVSIGIASTIPGEPVTDWVVRAIHGAMMAKKAGGNRVTKAPVHLGRAISRAFEDYISS